MASPLILLVCGAVVSGVVGSLFIIVSLSVDNWETFTYDTGVLAKYSNVNASSEFFCTVASSNTDYSNLVHTQTKVDTNGSKTQEVTSYFLFESYSGVWRICDILSGKYTPCRDLNTHLDYLSLKKLKQNKTISCILNCVFAYKLT